MSESDAKIERVDVAKAQIDKAVNKADGIITVSNASLKDLTDAYRRLPGKIFVIYHGVDDCFRKRWSLPSDYVMLKSIDRYILAVGAIQHRKNLSRLIRALAKLNTSAVTNHALIVAGPVGHGAEEVFATANEFCRQLPVHFTGYVSQLELAKLYQGADLFVYPSLHEGFGIPLLEAMASGTVIAASRTRAAMEICGDVALYFDPYDIDDIAEKVAVALKDEPLRTRLAAAALKRSATFSWSNAARATAEAYRALASAAVLHQAGQEAE